MATTHLGYTLASSSTVDENDRQIFREAVDGVRPLSTDKHHLEAGRKTSSKRRRSSPLSDQRLQHVSPRMADVEMNEALAYVGPGLQKRVLRKLRKGFFGIDAELDLHGLNAHEAKHLLFEFLTHCVQDNRRCVHVIHGKGYRSPDHKPVLKNKLNLWLRQHHDVIAFCSASPANGGTGAVYVLLQLH